MPTLRITSLLVLIMLAATIPARAQTTGAPASQPAAPATPDPAWSFRVSAATYILPDEENYVQPTVTADRGALHLETRYNYEDHESVSAFVGWNLEFGDTVKLALTPMIGGVGGQTDGVIPALTLDFTWRRLEFYSEGEYVIAAGRRNNNFLYNWSELSLWATEWLRAGMVTQRTRIFRTFRTTREIQRGALVGVAGSRLEGVVYLFNPGSDDQVLRGVNQRVVLTRATNQALLRISAWTAPR